ncbi:MAG: CHASE2 domain-containing protein [Symploca sp. SIO1C2]|nr:CHASE2 domain-containing protein [Symploca sp. SIO1C2]
MWLKLKIQIWQWRGVLIIASSIAGLAIVASSAGLFQLLEWASFDLFFRLRSPEAMDSRFVIVTIDESDIQQVGQWPIPDGTLAQVIKNLRVQQPRAIGMDLYRDLPVEPGHQELVQVFESTPNLIGIEKAAGSRVLPPPTLSELGQVAVADLILDSDGKVRRSLLSLRSEAGSTQLSLGAKLALMYLEAENIYLKPIAAPKLGLGKAVFVPFKGNDGGYIRGDDGGYQILLNFRGAIQDFRTISLTEVLENQLPPDLVRNRIVLIGSTAESLKDNFQTSYTTQLMPGVVIHANLASQIVSAAMEGRPLLKVWREPGEWLWTIICSFVGATGCWLLLQSNQLNQQLWLKWTVLVLSITLGEGILITGSYVAFLASWWLPVVSPLVAFTGSAVLIIFYHSFWLQQEKADLEILLETTTEHFHSVEAVLQDQTEEAIRAGEKRLIQFLEAVPVGVAVIDANGKPYYLNHKAQELFGKGVETSTSSEEFAEVYQNYVAGTDQLYPVDNLPLMRALRGESSAVDDIDIHQGDKIIPIEAWGTPIYDEEGNIRYAIVAFQDITERKRAEAERMRFTNELYQLNQANARFVPRQFLQLLNKQSIVDVKLGEAVQKEMSILFADIRSFTTLSERMSIEDNFKFINAYLSRMEPAIAENYGFIDKYIGDAIMALFSGCADDAVKAAIAMLRRLSEYNLLRQAEERSTIHIGVGINTGSLMLGTVGGPNRMDGTVISDAVNLAARLETLTKDYGVSLLISHHTFLQLNHPVEYAFRAIDRVTVKGKSEMVFVFEVFEVDPPELRKGKLATKSTFEQALWRYHQDCFQEAAELLQDCLKINPADRAAQIYLERCQAKCENNREWRMENGEWKMENG